MLEGLTPPKNKAVYCKIQQLSEELTESDRKILNDAMDSEMWSSKALSTALRQRGISAADTTITKHRNKSCACYRD